MKSIRVMILFFLSVQIMLFFPSLLYSQFNKKLSVQWLTGKDSLMKEAGLKGLVKYKSELSFKDASGELLPLVEKILLEDKDKKCRATAANVLGDLGIKSESKVLISALLNKENPSEVDSAIAAALLKLKDPGTVKELADAIANPDTSRITEVRVLLARTLGETKSLEASSILVELLGDIDLEVRKEAILSIEKIRYPDGKYFVIDVLAVDEEPSVRAAALEYLKKHGDRKSIEELEMIKGGKHKKKFAEVYAAIPSVIAEIKKRTGR